MVDADGVRQAVLQGDLAGSHSLDSAWFERSKTVPGFANLFTRLPHLMLFAPGIVIRVGDEVVRAIGAPAPFWTTPAPKPALHVREPCKR